MEYAVDVFRSATLLEQTFLSVCAMAAIAFGVFIFYVLVSFRHCCFGWNSITTETARFDARGYYLSQIAIRWMFVFLILMLVANVVGWFAGVIT